MHKLKNVLDKIGIASILLIALLGIISELENLYTNFAK
jgi:hypothetical protein